ncbi:cytosolic phospholipase A2 gamma-like isoform X2 [Malaclemys terrapin pileata]|uniref:cytosolic phospholipase A2 gamma-like isoform X2 n=1 Tax=Malaclemys terrapin pileata TaxID=2991368 RepID=UPI0023A7E3AF|nr:cytosolic phospholipase A2 gamma-like isoform X2 [Malaclemys terrapin pileata]
MCVFCLCNRCMSSLYNNGDWAEKLQALEKHMCDALTKSTWNLRKATEMLLEAAKDENYSLTEFWAYTVVYGMLHELDKGHLSEQRGASENGNNPYPIYAAVDERSFCKVTEYSPETWFEFTPHEASFLGYGASVPMEYFGSEYKNGVIKKQKEEKNMSYLQGLWGSCIGSKEENEKVIKDMFFGIFKRNRGSHSPFSVANESGWEGTLEGFPAPTLEPEASTMDSSITGEIVSSVGLAVDLARMLSKTTYDLLHWKWGTISNFLYKCSGIDTPELVNEKVISLVDAGIAINCAYPLVLRPDRKVKLILSFDYGPFDPFQTLKQAAKYCEENCIPFPKLDEKLLQDPDNPSDCYIFRGEGAPTVMHFPLFNKVNCPAFPCRKADARTVVKLLLKDFVPRFGIPVSINSDRGTHFTGQIVKELCAALQTQHNLHCPHHPQSAGTVERQNGILKNKLAKICAETNLKWPDALPLALMSMRATPNRKTGLSPHEILTGRPMRLPTAPPLTLAQMDIHLMDDTMLKYCQALMKCVKSFYTQVKEALPKDPVQPCHSLEPGDWVYIKVHQRKTALAPCWKGPFQVLLTTNTAVKCQGLPTWTHASHCKKTPPPGEDSPAADQPISPANSAVPPGQQGRRTR